MVSRVIIEVNVLGSDPAGVSFLHIDKPKACESASWRNSMLIDELKKNEKIGNAEPYALQK